MKKPFSWFALLASSSFVLTSGFLFSGCASIVSESSYPVAINSSPSNAKFTIKDESGAVVAQGVTPMTVTLDASDDFFSKAKYTIETVNADGSVNTTRLNADLDNWVFGNLLFGGIIGLVIDGATGAMYELPANVQIGGVSVLESHQQGAVQIVVLQSIPEELRLKLTPVL